MVQFKVVNHSLAVGCIEMLAVSSASLLQIGDTEHITLYSMFDTPPESLIVGPLAPLSPPEGSGEALGEGGSGARTAVQQGARYVSEAAKP